MKEKIDYKEEYEILLKTFRHRFKPLTSYFCEKYNRIMPETYDSSCAECGLDLRNPIHFRSGETE